MSINKLARFFAMSTTRKIAFRRAKESKKEQVKWNKFFNKM